MRSQNLHFFVELVLLSLITLSVAKKSHDFVTFSGRVVPSHALRRHLPKLSHTAWPHILFEHTANELLVSHHARLDIHRIASVTRTLVQNELVFDPIGNKAPYPALTHGTTIRSGNGYTFAYDALSRRLMAAWGPALQLHPLDSYGHPGLFLNAAAQNVYVQSNGSNSFVDRVALALSRTLRYAGKSRRKMPINNPPWTSTFPRQQEIKTIRCNRIFSLKLTMDYDASFEAMYLPNVRQSLIGLLEHVRPLFEDAACVRLSIHEFSLLQDGYDGFYPYFPDFQKCTEGISCRASYYMLHYLWLQNNHHFDYNRGIKFLFTGYSDGTALAGASYRAAVCSSHLAVAWVEKGSAAVFAHELGHMFGAPHDEKGIMKPRIDPAEPLMLSTNSMAAIIRFVERDPRSWCLRRNLTDGGIKLGFDNGWIACKTMNSTLSDESSISDATMASLVSDHSKDLVTIFTTERDLGSSLTFTVTTNISFSENKCQAKIAFFSKGTRWAGGQARLPLSKHLVQLMYPSGTFGFGVAFGHIRHATSKDIIVSDVKIFQKSTKVSYKVGFNMPIDGSIPTTWSAYQTIPGYTTENIICASITLGHIRTAYSNDLVHIHIEKIGQRHVAFYRVGFDIGPDGYAQGGWTNKFHVKGWYGDDTTSVSIALYDLDKNGQPEIIMSHEDQSWAVNRAFIRIGKNVNNAGLVTGGWSEFVEMRKLQLHYSKTLTMAVADLSDKRPTVIAASQEIENENQVRLDINSELLTPRMLETCKTRLPPLRSFFEGCGECYSLQNARLCRKEVSHCESKIDEVWLSDREQTSSRSIKNHIIAKQRKLSTPYRLASKVSRKEDVKSQIQLEKRTAYCEGFHYLFQLTGGCFVIDRARVIAEGLRQTFTDALIEEDRKIFDALSSEIMDEDPAATNGVQK